MTNGIALYWNSVRTFSINKKVSIQTTRTYFKQNKTRYSSYKKRISKGTIKTKGTPRPTSRPALTRIQASVNKLNLSPQDSKRLTSDIYSTSIMERAELKKRNLKDKGFYMQYDIFYIEVGGESPPTAHEVKLETGTKYFTCITSWILFINIKMKRYENQLGQNIQYRSQRIKQPLGRY